MNIGKYFRRQPSSAHLPQVLQVAANLMKETPFYFKSKEFSMEKLKKLR